MRAQARTAPPPSLRTSLLTILLTLLPLPALAAARGSEPAAAPLFTVHGRLSTGIVYRLEDADPRLPFALNGAAAGVPALNGTGANADDANLNFRRHDAVSRTLAASVELQAHYRNTRALLRVKAWRDNALRNDAHDWGSVANGYRAGAPLSDAGAPPLSRFAGVVVGDAWVEQVVDAGRARLLARIGQHSLDWGNNTGFGGGLEVLAPRDLPASRRAGATAADLKVPLPQLLVRAEWDRNGAVELFYQGRFRPNALDMCGTFFAPTDYAADGCDKVMSGAPAASDRARVALGAYLKRLPTPKPRAAQFGVALRWKLAGGAVDVGAYHARYTSRTAVPGLRKSTRTGPAYVVGDPDGRNLAFFTEYPQAIHIDALTFAHRAGAFGELSYRPNMPLLFGPGDGLPPFISATAPAQLRQLADATAPGGLFHGYERYPMWQAQLGWQRPLAAGGIGWAVEVVAKHVANLPDPALRRYGRADVFGAGPVHGVCAVNMTVPALQCSARGYVSRNAAAWRARVETRLPPLANGMTASVFASLVHDVHGWSADALINQGRRSASVGLRAELDQRYLFEATWLPVWGGDYNAGADRDTLALAVGIKF